MDNYKSFWIHFGMSIVIKIRKLVTTNYIFALQFIYTIFMFQLCVLLKCVLRVRTMYRWSRVMTPPTRVHIPGAHVYTYGMCSLKFQWDMSMAKHYLGVAVIMLPLFGNLGFVKIKVDGGGGGGSQCPLDHRSLQFAETNKGNILVLQRWCVRAFPILLCLKSWRIVWRWPLMLI